MTLWMVYNFSDHGRFATHRPPRWNVPRERMSEYRMRMFPLPPVGGAVAINAGAVAPVGDCRCAVQNGRRGCQTLLRHRASDH